MHVGPLLPAEAQVGHSWVSQCLSKLNIGEGVTANLTKRQNATESSVLKGKLPWYYADRQTMGVQGTGHMCVWAQWHQRVHQCTL